MNNSAIVVPSLSAWRINMPTVKKSREKSSELLLPNRRDPVRFVVFNATKSMASYYEFSINDVLFMRNLQFMTYLLRKLEEALLEE